jgi:hypothetical protein
MTDNSNLFLQTDSSSSSQDEKKDTDFTSDSEKEENEVIIKAVTINTDNSINYRQVTPPPLLRNAITSIVDVKMDQEPITVKPEIIHKPKPIHIKPNIIDNFDKLNNVFELLRRTLDMFGEVREERIIQKEKNFELIKSISKDEQEFLYRTLKDDNNFYNGIYNIINNAYAELCSIREKNSELKISSINIKLDKDNGWDNEANKTLTNWFDLFKETSFIYQWIYDRNIKKASILTIISAVTSAVLSLISGFKLWQNDNLTFSFVTDIILMVINLIIAVFIAISKTILDDKKNEEIRQYIEDIDRFNGIISAQFLKTTNYRTNADEFFKEYNDEYTRLVSLAPNISIGNLAKAKDAYNRHLIMQKNKLNEVKINKD